MRNPVPINYRPPDLSDYEEPLDLIDDGLIDLSRAVQYQSENLRMYAATSFMDAARRFMKAGEELEQYREVLLRFVVPDLWRLAEKAEHINGIVPLRPDVSYILGKLEGIITAENYLWSRLSSWRKIERIRKTFNRRNPDTSHGMCPECFSAQMLELGVIPSEEKLERISKQKHAPGMRVVCGWCDKVLQEGNERNPDADIRKLEREYAASPSEELMEHLIRAYTRRGDFRLFHFSEGWQAQTTLGDGRVISSATQSHDGWWGIGHATWKEDGKMSDLGDHAVSDYPSPIPTREQVFRAHFEVVDFIREHGMDGVPSQYHRWRSFRDNPDIAIRELEREYYASPSPEALRQLNTIRERSGVEVELPVQHLQMLFEGMVKLLGKTLDQADTDQPWQWESGRGDTIKREKGIFKIEGFYPTGDDSDEFIKLMAYNLYDPEEKYINVHINVKRYRPGKKRAYQQASVEIYPDDVMYVAKSSYSRGSDEYESYTLPTNQPWVYHAKDLLDYVVRLA